MKSSRHSHNTSELKNSSDSVAADRRANSAKVRERAFYLRLGSVALATALIATPAITKHRTTKNQNSTIKMEESADTYLDSTLSTSDIEVVTKEPKARAMTKVITMGEPSKPESQPEYGPELESEFETSDSDFEWLEEQPEKASHTSIRPENSNQNSSVLNAVNGRINGPTGEETYYNLPMGKVVEIMHDMGIEGEYWEREDGVKMLGDYIMVAANLNKYPRGTIVETSLGKGIVCDTGDFANTNQNQLDIATNWKTIKK